MYKLFYILSIGLLLAGCKGAKNTFLLDEALARKSKTSLVILNEHSKNAQAFETVFIKGNANYASASQSEKASIEIQIEKDKQIYINIRYKGISVAKALITPDQVRYYEKLNRGYAEGDFGLLSRLLGKDITYNHLQNILLGQVLDSEAGDDMTASIQGGLHKLSPVDKTTVQSTYFFEDKSTLLKKEEITSPQSDHKVTISYPKYQKVNNYVLPTGININAALEKTTQVKISYNKVTFNEALSIKYKVPDDYRSLTP